MKKLILSLVFFFFIASSYSQKQVIFNVDFVGDKHETVSAASYDYINNKFIPYEPNIIKINTKKEKILLEITPISSIVSPPGR